MKMYQYVLAEAYMKVGKDVNGCWVERKGCCIDVRSNTTYNGLTTRGKCMDFSEEGG